MLSVTKLKLQNFWPFLDVMKNGTFVTKKCNIVTFLKQKRNSQNPCAAGVFGFLLRFYKKIPY